MRVNIDEIKEAGLRRSWDVAREQVDDMIAGDRAGYRARGPAHVEAKLDRLERRVRVAARAGRAGRGVQPLPRARRAGRPGGLRHHARAR